MLPTWVHRPQKSIRIYVAHRSVGHSSHVSTTVDAAATSPMSRAKLVPRRMPVPQTCQLRPGFSQVTTAHLLTFFTENLDIVRPSATLQPKNRTSYLPIPCSLTADSELSRVQRVLQCVSQEQSPAGAFARQEPALVSLGKQQANISAHQSGANPQLFGAKKDQPLAAKRRQS